MTTHPHPTPQSRRRSRPHLRCGCLTAPVTPSELDQAIALLGDFILERAAATEAQLGFGYVLRADAPSSYPDLLAAFEVAQRSAAPLPISSENSGTAVYADPAVNGALRFWHDVNHVRQGLSFSVVDELELSLWHLGELEAAGHRRGSLVWRLLHADLTGQGYVQAFAKRFPADQRRFVVDCATTGFDHGLLRELRDDGAAGDRP